MNTAPRFSVATLLCAAAAVSMTPAQADENGSALALAVAPGQPSEAEEIELAEYTVSETPILEARRAFEQDRLHDPLPFTGTTRDDFEHRPNNRAGDILKRLPGVFMGGPPGERNDLRLRGLDKEFTRAQLDGMPLPDGGEKRELQFDRLPAQFVDEVRVLRSPTAEFESDGLAGRVAITSAPIAENFNGRVRGAWGERNTSDAALWHFSGQLEGRVLPWLGLQGTASYFDDPCIKTKHEETATAAGAPGKVVDEVEAKRLTATDFYGKAATYWDGGFAELRPLTLELRERKEKTRHELDPAKAAAADEAFESETEDKSKNTDGLGGSASHRFAGGWTVDLGAAVNRTWEEKTDKVKQTYKESAGAFVADKRTVENEDKEDRARELHLGVSAPFGGAGMMHRVKAGLAWRARDRFRDKQVTEYNAAGVGSDKTSPKDTYSIDEDYSAAYVQDSVALGSRFTLVPGVRVETVDLESADRDGTVADTTHTDINPSLHTSWRASEGMVVKLSVARAVNRPKFDDLSPYEVETGDRYLRGNPDLQPARATNCDLSFEYVRADVFLGVNVFYKDIADLIEESPTGEFIGTKPVHQIQNVGDGWTYGLELEQRLTFGWTGVHALRGLTLWANQTFLRSEYTNAAGSKQPFKEQPEFLANVGLDWELGWFIVTTSAQHRGVRQSFEGNATKELAAETIYDLAARVRLTERVWVFAEIANLTDETRRETTWKADGSLVNKFERGGRSLQAGVACTF